jgi:hypothetical protein
VLLYLKALEINEQTLGRDHPTTAGVYSNLALILDVQGKHAEAEPLHRKALLIRDRVVGPDQAETASSLNNLAGNLSE